MPESGAAIPAPLTPELAGLLARALGEVAASLRDGSDVAPEALTPEQAAKLCGVSISKWHQMAATSQTPSPIQLGDSGRCPRYLRGELLAWLKAGAPSRSRWELIRPPELKRTG